MISLYVIAIESGNISLQITMVLEKKLINMVQVNNPVEWRKLYDKYASAMYRLIYNLTKDKSLAEEILMDAFLDLKQKKILSKPKCALYPIIMRHTYSFTTKHLREISISPENSNPPKEAELIHLLTTQCNSLKEAASILNISDKEAKIRLQVEFSSLRRLSNIPSNQN
jgi:DNA-directed RNA polymerase specialized sigma24 family protein